MNQKQMDIPGYVHPENITVTKGSRYKTFTEGERPKKKEKFGTTDVGNNYASIHTEQETNSTKEDLEQQRNTFSMNHLSSKS